MVKGYCATYQLSPPPYPNGCHSVQISDRWRSGCASYCSFRNPKRLAMLKILSLCVIAFLSPAPTIAQTRDAGVDKRVVDLPLGSGVSQRALYVAPPRPRATLVMLPGGDGEVGVQRNGNLHQDHNFVVRTREAWTGRGYAVLIPDSIAQASLRGVRSSRGYRQIVDKLVAYAHARADAPIFLVGTSQGTIAAVNGAAHALPHSLSGLVLTEAVSLPGRLSTETVFDADPQSVDVPTLIVANRDDSCNVAPPGMAPRIAAALSRSPEVRVMLVEGGIQRSAKPCGSLSPHGYFGIEEKVVGGIDAWLRTHGAQSKG